MKTLTMSVILILALLPTMAFGEDVTTCVPGYSDWWEAGQILWFRGDCGCSYPDACDIDCSCWQECGVIDDCFIFQEVTGFDEEECSHETSGKIWGTRADGCFLAGLGGYGPCAFCDEKNDYCVSYWEVTVFNALPGDVEGGCYLLTLVCANPESDCLHAKPDEHCAQ